MNWGSWNEFFAMGGYGFYVWGAYAVTLVVMLGEVLLVRARAVAARRDLERVGAARDGAMK